MSILTFSVIAISTLINLSIIIYLVIKNNKYVDIIKRLRYELDGVEGLLPHDSRRIKNAKIILYECDIK